MSVYVPIRPAKKSQISMGKMPRTMSPIHSISDTLLETPSLSKGNYSGKDEWSGHVRGCIALVKSYRPTQSNTLQDKKDHIIVSLSDNYLTPRDKDEIATLCVTLLWRFRAREDAQVTKGKQNILDNPSQDSWAMDVKRSTQAEVDAQTMNQMLAIKKFKAELQEIIKNAKAIYGIPKGPVKVSTGLPSLVVNAAQGHHHGTVTLSCENDYMLYVTLKELWSEFNGVTLYSSPMPKSTRKDGISTVTIPVYSEQQWYCLTRLCVTPYDQPITTPWSSMFVEGDLARRGVTIS